MSRTQIIPILHKSKKTYLGGQYLTTSTENSTKNQERLHTLCMVCQEWALDFDEKFLKGCWDFLLEK